jgi:hypothetical protein
VLNYWLRAEKLNTEKMQNHETLGPKIFLVPKLRGLGTPIREALRREQHSNRREISNWGISNCKLQIANCKLDAQACLPKFSICNLHFAIPLCSFPISGFASINSPGADGTRVA